MKIRMTLFAFVFSFLLSAAFAMDGKMGTYTVKAGDDVVNVAFYLRKVEGVNIARLREWNPGLGTSIKAGQVIFYEIPDASPRPATKEEIRLEIDRAIGNFPKPQPPAVNVGAGVPLIDWVIFSCFILITAVAMFATREKSEQGASGKNGGVLVNPTPTDLRAAKLPHGVVYALLREGRSYRGVAKLVGGKPMIYFDGEKNSPIGPEHAMRHALKLAGVNKNPAMTQTVNVVPTTN